MKQLKPLWLKGIIKLKVYGHYPERFFELCSRHNITVWSIKKESDIECVGDVYFSEIHKIRSLRRKTHYKIRFKQRKGFPFFYKKLIRKQALLISFFLAGLFFMYLTQSIWFINIEGVPLEMKEAIEKTLDDYGVKRGKLKLLMDKPNQIQTQLLRDYENLLWVGVVPDGVTYRLEVIPKKQPTESEKNQRTHLYAKKDGVISEMFVAKGRPLVEVNDFVKKGQLLVTGELNPNELDEEENEETDFITIDAEIYATTWYESKVKVPLKGNYQVETGLDKQKFYLEIGSFRLPFWGLRATGFSHEKIESNMSSLSIAGWEVPLSIVKQTHKEIELLQEERSETEAVNIGLEQARKNLSRKLDATSTIIADKILHQSIDNGKVKVHVYFTVNENIVNTTSSKQGD